MTPLSAIRPTPPTEAPKPAARAVATEATKRFDDAVASAATTGAAAAPHEPSISKVYRGSRSGVMPPSQQFESFVLRSFVESMLPQEESEYFGTGTAGKIWKSMLAERIGDEMAKDGGIGIADMIDKHGTKAKDVTDGQEKLARAGTMATGAAALKGLGLK
ncbi:rod-binding protein [Aureimonas sp. SA4125]|uniref:rod-binding protein n=1 Tax=Aureimonas sp. SA4125 TaxID=2826993 RepID=UPI001CC69C39|nr:rod-binding protein [Aureimonas sp. SA4125]